MSPISVFCPFCLQRTAVGGESWWIGECHYCHNAMLCCKDGTIYPTPRPEPTASEIPAAIAADLDEAKTCFVNDCFRACSVMARRCPEASCVEKGATGKTLVQKIDDLRTKGVITADLVEWARIRDQFATATEGIGGATIAALRDILATQQAQAKEIETLRTDRRSGGDTGR